MADFISSDDAFSLGERICDTDSCKGTVKYIGKVASAKNINDIWIGIEWDDSSRGKHDGSCVDSDGILHRYFHCKSSTGGSFLKPNKIVRGRNFTEALRERYVALDAPEVAPDAIIPDAFVQTSKGKLKSIQFIGEKKIRVRQQIETVTKISIRNDTVAIIDDIAAIAAHFTEVDLQDNLLFKWSEVAKLTSQLPLLDTLLLQSNKLQQFDTTVKSSLSKDCFGNLKVLALNSCNITAFATVQLLEEFLPKIEELYLACNLLSDCPVYLPFEESSAVAVAGFANLRVLDLCECGLDCWGQVLSLGLLPALEELRLDGNALGSVLPAPASTFVSLSRVSLAYTKLSSWDDVNALSSYPIQNIRLSHVPLAIGKGLTQVRLEVLARMPKLVQYNASEVKDRERFDAERLYLRQLLRDELDIRAKADDSLLASFYNTNPRFNELKGRFSGDVVILAETSQGGSLASDMITVTLHNVTTSGFGSEPAVKKLPATLTVMKLKMIVKQLFGKATHEQVLSYRNNKDGIPLPLDDDSRTLTYLGVTDSADIYVGEV